MINKKKLEIDLIRNLVPVINDCVIDFLNKHSELTDDFPGLNQTKIVVSALVGALCHSLLVGTHEGKLIEACEQIIDMVKENFNHIIAQEDTLKELLRNAQKK